MTYKTPRQNIFGRGRGRGGEGDKRVGIDGQGVEVSVFPRISIMGLECQVKSPNLGRFDISFKCLLVVQLWLFFVGCLTPAWPNDIDKCITGFFPFLSYSISITALK